MSRLITNSIRSTSASADAITLDGSGNATFPANVTCSGTAAGFGGGKILQVVESSSSTTVTTTSQTDLLTLSITPSSASNKVLIFMHVLVQCNPSTNAKGYVRLYRGTSSGTMILDAKDGGEGAHSRNVTVSGQKLDSPNTSSAQTYTMTLDKLSGGTSTVSTDGNSYYLQAMEIAA